MCAFLAPFAAAEVARNAGNAQENAPLLQSATWQYARPKCNGGPLQEHLDAFKGYTRYAQYPAKAVADIDWQAVVRKVLGAQAYSWNAEEVSEAALHWARLACPDMTKSHLSQLQCLGAWTMDYCYTARRVQPKSSKSWDCFHSSPKRQLLFYCSGFWHAANAARAGTRIKR